MAKNERTKYEGATDQKMSGHAWKVLVFGVLTAALFVGIAFNIMLG